MTRDPSETARRRGGSSGPHVSDEGPAPRFPGTSRLKQRGSAILMILCCLPLSGCITRLFGGGGEPTVQGDKTSIPVSRLERIIFNFADRNVTLISDACSAIKREAVTEEERRRAQHFKLANGTAVFDIVTSPNLLSHLVDLYVMIHLQHLFFVGEGNGVRLFGEKGAGRLAAALEQLRTEVGHLADLSMKTARRTQLDQMIQEWRLRNPDVECVSGIRFGNLPGVAGRSILASLRGYFDVLNPLDDTSRSVDESRQLAERAFYFSKRLPKLLNWQAESALDDMLAKSDVHQALQDVTQTSESIERVSRVIERVPVQIAAEWKEFLSNWDTREKHVSTTLKEIRATFVEGQELAAQVRSAGEAFELTFDSINRLVEPSNEEPSGEPGRPFDIIDYKITAVEIAKMARDAHALVKDGHSLLTSTAWTKRQEDVSRLAGEAVAHAELGSRRLVDHIGWRMAQVMILFFSLLLLYRVVVTRVQGKRAISGAAGLTAKDPLQGP